MKKILIAFLVVLSILLAMSGAFSVFATLTDGDSFGRLLVVPFALAGLLLLVARSLHKRTRG